MSELSPISRASVGARTQGGETPWGAFSSRHAKPSGGQKQGSQGTADATQDPANKEQIQKLEKRDREVRAHEAAHKSAAGSLATGSASFEYERGPDGKLYAVGGEVGIKIAKGRSPEETIEKARQVRAAAMAPAQPSGQDMAVASRAAAMEQQAAREKQASASAAAGQGANSRFSVYTRNQASPTAPESSLSVTA